MIFFTSDTHFNHNNIINYCNRPFKNVKDMNSTIIKNWNNVIKDKDLVYHLGDFGFGDIISIRKQLNGNIILIKGGHDKLLNEEEKKLFDKIFSLYNFSYKKHIIILCHYCMKVWEKSHYNSFHLFGHSHGGLKAEGKSYDVGVDTNNFTPICIDNLMDIMNKKPNNFNLVGIKNDRYNKMRQ